MLDPVDKTKEEGLQGDVFKLTECKEIINKDIQSMLPWFTTVWIKQYAKNVYDNPDV